MASVRMNVSLPEELKGRMDAVAEVEDVNWSSVASRAFEEKLGEIASHKREKTMQDVIDRLRASKRSGDEEDAKLGRDTGERWAKDRAEASDLQTIESLRLRRDLWDYTFHSDVGDAEPRVLLAARMLGDDAGRSEIVEWWQWAAGCISDDDVERLSPAFVESFALGALDVWNEVKHAVR